MTDEWADLRAKAEAATPGPWEVEPQRVWHSGKRHARSAWGVVGPDHWVARGGTLDAPEADAAYIAAASPDVIVRLLDERDRLRDELREAKRLLERWYSPDDADPVIETMNLIGRPMPQGEASRG